METVQCGKEWNTWFGFVHKTEADQKKTVLPQKLELSFSCDK